MNIKYFVFALHLALLAPLALAQQSTPNQEAAARAPQPWIYKTKELSRAEIDSLLTKPEKIVVIDVRRPDELVSKGGFPVYLSIQAKELESQLAYIPRDREIITVSNHAHRAGAAGDLLSSKGFRIAGAAGSEDYEAQGGKITRITAPAPRAPR